MEHSEEKIKRLPKWAQDHIRNLEQDAGIQRGRADAQWSDEPTGFCIRRYTFSPSITKKFFALEHGDDVLCNGVSVSSNVHHQGKAYITAMDMIIEPIASNCVAIKGSDR